MSKKIVGFNSNEEAYNKLHDMVESKKVTKKDWFETNLNKDILQSKLELHSKEKFITIPSSEYEQLLTKNPRKHSKFICDRIMDHILSQQKDPTFDNMWFETKTFQQMNGIMCKREQEQGGEVIHCIHEMGINTSMFLAYLAIEMIKTSGEYRLKNKLILQNNFILKIEKVNR